MTSLLRKLLLVTLVGLALSWPALLGCHPSVVATSPKVNCPLPPDPVATVLSPGSPDPEHISLTNAEATALGLQLRDECRWRQMASACLGLAQTVECP